METYILVYFSSAVLAGAITPAVIYAARRLNVLDTPNMRKVHSNPTPRIGGMSIVIPMMLVSLYILLSNASEYTKVISPKLFVLLATAGFIFIVGILDDFKNLSVAVKFLCQFFAAIIICSFDIRIQSIPISNSVTLELGWFSWPLTIFWIVGITNAVNLIDGLDGLAAGVSLIACGVITILSIVFHRPLLAIILFSLWGSLTVFLLFNFHPAKIFLGDSGSLFLGFFLASSSVLCASRSGVTSGYTLPILALIIPIFDTLFSMLRRFIDRRSMFSSDRGHFHHRLLEVGLHHWQAVLTIYLLTLIAVIVGLPMLYLDNTYALIIFTGILFTMIFAFKSVGCISFGETLIGLKRKHSIYLEIKDEVKKFEKVELCFRHAETFDQWWQAVCLAAEYMKFTTLCLPVTNRDGTLRFLVWENKERRDDSHNNVWMTVPVTDLRKGSTLKLEVEIYIDGSLESVGRRVTLFARLIEQYRFAAAKNAKHNKLEKVASEFTRCLTENNDIMVEDKILNSNS